MSSRTWLRAGLQAVAGAAALMFATPVLAVYPERPITLVVPFAAGGPTDIISRLMAEPMSRALGQQVIVENVVGGGGTVGVTRVAKAPPDGYMLLMGNLGTQAASVGLYPNLAYDPRTDFEPIMNTGGTPMIVAAKKDLPVKDFREFITYLKKNDSKVNYGTGGVGATSHLTCLFLDALLNVKPQHIPFRGSGPALNALLGGQVDYVCDQTVGVVPSIQAKMINGLVVALRASRSFLTCRRRPSRACRNSRPWAGTRCSRPRGRRKRSSTGSMSWRARRSRTTTPASGSWSLRSSSLPNPLKRPRRSASS